MGKWVELEESFTQSLQPLGSSKPLRLIYRNVSNYLTCLDFVFHLFSPVDVDRLLGISFLMRRVEHAHRGGVCSGLVKNALSGGSAEFSAATETCLVTVSRASRDETLPEQICWHCLRVQIRKADWVKPVLHNNGVTK